MCGISGFFDPSLSKNDADAVIESMLRAIAHRGPDARGTFWQEGLMLGHNRLSIIDLSHEADQPMLYHDLVMVFNGEIYNYLEIRQQLLAKGYSFSTQSDTEVVMASYKEWGTACVNYFVGMWSLALYDKSNQLLFASRDRFGIKPFYYIQQGSRFYFASEFKALKQSPVFSPGLNLSQVSRGLQMGWLCYKDETYFEKIKALPAAHNLILKLGKTGSVEPEIQRYWDIEPGQYSDQSFSSKVEQFREMFSQSVDLHMRSDVPVATCLSGGLDSSAIVSMVQHQHPGTSYKSFSIYYDGDGEVDERPFIREVIRKYPGIEPFYKQPGEDEIIGEFHRALYHADVPSTGSSFISQYFLMKLIAANGIKVVLDGQGSDEYLAGYMHTFYRLIGGTIRHGNLGKALSSTRDLSAKLSLSAAKTISHFGKSVLSAVSGEQQLYGLEFNSYYPFLMAEKPSELPFSLEQGKGSQMDKFLYHLLFATSLPSLLQYEDRNSMAFSIESRVPFLDHRLVEFAFSLRDEDKIRGTETKYILRKALADVLPDAITNRQDKKGFVTPGENKWLRGPLKHLLDIDYSNLDFLNKERVAGLVEQYRKGDTSRAVLVWRIATLNYWIKNLV